MNINYDIHKRNEDKYSNIQMKIARSSLFFIFVDVSMNAGLYVVQIKF